MLNQSHSLEIRRSTRSNYYGNAQTEAASCDAQYGNTSSQFGQSVTGIGTVTAHGYATTTESGAAGTAISDANSNAEVGQYGGYGTTPVITSSSCSRSARRSI
jgi:hypothetical protein